MALIQCEIQPVNLQAEYKKISTTLSTLGYSCLNSLSSENKIENLIKLTNLIGDNFAFIIKHECTFAEKRPLESFCDMLYSKLFEWINETINEEDLEPNYLINFRKIAKIYHSIYEKNRYASWICIKTRFKLDDNIMFRINSYLHYFVTNKSRILL